MKKFLLCACLMFTLGACTRIETGEVGLRLGFDKQINQTELLPGSFNQTVVGNVITFPTRDIAINIENKQPMTSDNSALSDFDLMIVYQINQSSVSELYTGKTKSFHAYNEKDGDWYLMYNYMQTIVNAASYKVVRQYESLKVADNRANIEQAIEKEVNETLKREKLDAALQVTQVQVRSILPAAEIIKAANEYVRAQNDLRVKSTEVEIARKEAERIAAVTTNANALEYMKVQTSMKIAEAIAAGKVNTLIIPANFNGILNVGQK